MIIQVYVIVDKIKTILEKNGYKVDSDVILRINTMTESIRDDNQVNKLDYIIEWFNEKRKKSDMIVEEIALLDDNYILMTDIFPLGSTEDARNYT